MSDRPLAGKAIYVARPIDLNRHTLDHISGVERVHRDLTDLGAVTYDPSGAFRVPGGSEPHGWVQSVNRHAIHNCDGFVACWPELSVGVPMELQLADTLRKPCAVLTGVGDRSWALAGVEAVGVFATATWHLNFADAVVGAELRTECPDDQLRYVGPHEFAPRRSHDDDAGFDLFVSEETWIPHGEVVDVPCGVKLEMPPGFFGLVVGRSSTSRKHHLRVDLGVIDGGYRGDMFAAVHNTGPRGFRAEVGMRLAQILPLPNMAETMDVMRAARLSEGTRGDAGFGSTGP